MGFFQGKIHEESLVGRADGASSAWTGASQLPSASIHGPGLLPRANRETQNADAMLILDMGEYMFHDFPELGLDNQLGAAALKGFNLMQILPGALATRASMFPPLPVTHQVMFKRIILKPVARWHLFYESLHWMSESMSDECQLPV